MRSVFHGVSRSSGARLVLHHTTRVSAAAAATATQAPWRLPSPATSFSTLSTGQATTAISTRNPNPEATSVTALGTTLDVEWDDGHSSCYHQTWLRVNCPSFVHESGHRTVFPGDVESVVPVLSISEVKRERHRVTITWSDGHASVYNFDWLRAHDNSPSALHERSHGSRTSCLSAWEAIPKVDGREYMETNEGLYAALRKMNRAGVVLLENVGVAEKTVLDLARRVGSISHEGSHGEFDVDSQAEARNVAGVNEGLRLHMDLPYYESPPGLQFVHCLEFDSGVKGGATNVLDAFAAAEHFRDNFPDHFEVLSRVPTTFEMVRAPAANVKWEERQREVLASAQLEVQKPIFQVDAEGELLGVTWAPMFEGALICSVNDMELYHKAHAEFLRVIEEGQFARSHTVRKRLEPGQCLVFNNRRMLHGRDAFSFSGESDRRRFQGTYVSADEAMSRLCSLHAERSSSSSPASSGDDSAPDYLTRFGNGSLPRVW